MHNMTPEQLRMARAALNWSIQELGYQATVNRNTITRFESGGDVRVSTLNKIKKALEAAGVEFIAENGGGPGVRLKKIS